MSRRVLRECGPGSQVRVRLRPGGLGAFLVSFVFLPAPSMLNSSASSKKCNRSVTDNIGAAPSVLLFVPLLEEFSLPSTIYGEGTFRSINKLMRCGLPMEISMNQQNQGGQQGDQKPDQQTQKPGQGGQQGGGQGGQRQGGQQNR